MAEIIRTRIRVERRHTRIGADTEPVISTEVRTVVRSIHGGDASVIRDFVKGLDSAEAPGTARIEARRTDAGHLSGLVAEWTRIEEAADETP